ncbi:MAG: pyridoxamine 5'-phosphate oxidase family protein [Cyanobacteria bacterium P01_A01_bin.123]
MTSFDAALSAYQRFPVALQSAMLSTVNAEGIPNASYAPFVMDEQRNFYIYVSGLAPHTHNLEATGKVSLLLIEDESQVKQIFARQRLTYNCNVTLLLRESEPWNAIADQFEARFGNIIQMLRGLGDFRIFKLKPYGGRFVMGFGAAYGIDPQDLNQLVSLPR